MTNSTNALPSPRAESRVRFVVKIDGVWSGFRGVWRAVFRMVTLSQMVDELMTQDGGNTIPF